MNFRGYYDAQEIWLPDPVLQQHQVSEVAEQTLRMRVAGQSGVLDAHGLGRQEGTAAPRPGDGAEMAKDPAASAEGRGGNR